MPKTPATANPASAQSYEHAREELAEVVGRLEAGGLTLDESLRLWERGEHLARVCGQFLDGARARVESALARAQQAEVEAEPDGADPGPDGATVGDLEEDTADNDGPDGQAE